MRPASHSLPVRRRGEQRLPERAFGLAEGDRLDPAAVVAGGDHAEMAVADHVRLDDAHRPGGDARARPAGAIGPAGLERVALGPALTPPGASRASSSKARSSRLRATSAASRSSRKSASASIRSPATVSPAAMAWPPPAMSRPLSFAASTAAPRSTPRDRAARALADAVLAERDDDGRAAELLLEPPGDDADHAGMPARRGDERDRAIALARRQSASAASQTAASIARRSSFSRSSSAAIAARFVGILGGQQPHAEVRLADPAAGIDPRPEREAEIGAGRRARSAAPPRRARRGRHCARRAITFSPWATKARLRPRSWATSATVPSATRSSRSISFGSSRPAKKPRARNVRSKAAPSRKAHADRGEMAVRGASSALVEPVRIDQRKASGSAAGAFVMIDDDHVDAGRARHAPAPRRPGRRNRR